MNFINPIKEKLVYEEDMPVTTKGDKMFHGFGLQNLPTEETPYSANMNWGVIILFCVIPMVAWAITLLVMKGYELTGPRMKEIQAINAARKEAIAGGMSLEDAIAKWQTIEDVDKK